MSGCLGVDVLRDDGFYSAALLKFPKNGYNSVKVRASAKEGNETQLVKGAGSRAFQLLPVNGSTYLFGLDWVACLKCSFAITHGELEEFVSARCLFWKYKHQRTLY